MRYMQCRCGRRTCWTTMGHPSCDGCPECHTTLAEGPSGHTDIQPHRFGPPRWIIDSESGERWQERICAACMHKEKV